MEQSRPSRPGAIAQNQTTAPSPNRADEERKKGPMGPFVVSSEPASLHIGEAGRRPVIGAVQISPAAAVAGQAVLALVTARIDAPGLVAGSAVLQKLDAQGRVLANLGVLRDDGAEGDAAAGDDWAAPLQAWLDGRLARYKWPRRWVQLPALPRTALGKVQKPAVRAWLASQAAAPVCSGGSSNDMIDGPCQASHGKRGANSSVSLVDRR